MMFQTSDKLTPIPYEYLPADFPIDSWEAVKAMLEELCCANPQSAKALETLLEKYSELMKAIADELSWRYIRMTQNADDPALADAYNSFFADVAAPSEIYQFHIKKLFMNCPCRQELDKDYYALLNQIYAKDLDIFREENISLQIDESELANQYGSIVSKMSAHFDGEERTPSQLAVYLKEPDRSKREQAWMLRMGLFADKQNELNGLFDELRKLRHQIAINAGFKNYRDYKHTEKGRFSYGPEDLFKFHDAVEQVVVPFMTKLNHKRKDALKVDTLRPWDMAVDLDGRKLQPFDSTEEFILKSLKVLNKVNPEYARQLEMMNNSSMLDLENRKGKAPGGYNSAINNVASSFIFMNHVKLHNDVVTLLHESGHAMHSAAIAPIKIYQYLDTPSEVAELASMTMEMLTMDYWDEFYRDDTDLKKAKRDQLEGTLSFLPWCMIVDAFQHWVYLHPDHTPQQRSEANVDLHKRFMPDVDWRGLDDFRKVGWMMQLHIFEVPFYYIEYGMSQLGALSIYMNYRKNPVQALKQYQAFLNLGYSKPVKHIFETAGIKFDFSEARIRELTDFVSQELDSIDKK